MSVILYRNLKCAKGFTLVEVIVVAVIVAVLATVAIPLYTNYVESAKKGTINNCAGSLASFLSTGLSLGAIETGSGTSTYKGDDNNTIKSKVSNPDFESQFIIPPGIVCDINWAEGTLVCSKGEDSSSTYTFKANNTNE